MGVQLVRDGTEPLIDFRNVTVIRGNTVALDRLTLKIAPGENVAIVGPNGSGKSTLLKTITREVHPLAKDDSHARILGRQNWELSQLRDHVGVVMNDFFARSSRNPTGKELVLSGFFGSFGVWPHHRVTPEMEIKAETTLKILGVAHLAGKAFGQMSSGERKRMMIGRALIHNPQALVLDEPSDSLDLAALKALQRTLRSLAQSGISMILVTHHLHEIIPEISRVILLKSGKVFRDGPKAKILSKATLSELFEMEVEPVEKDGYYQFW